MKIRELSVHNYRPFKERPPFEFGEQFSVIAGVNGRGKTAVLDAIALCLTRLLSQISLLRPAYRYFQPSDIHHGTDNLKLEMKLNCAGYPINDFTVTYSSAGGSPEFSHLPTQVKFEIQRLYSALGNTQASITPIGIYYTTDRAGFRKPKSLPARLPITRRATAQSGALHNRMVNYKDFMARFHASVQREATERLGNPAYFSDRVVETIQRALSTFLDGFSNLRVELRPLKLLVDKQVGDGIVPLELGQMSDGERSFLAMICDLCRRLAIANPELPDILQGQGVVLIDELELHLHPRWQREVVEKLRTTFPNIQFIVTTHSPFVVQTARAGEIVKLDGELAVEPAGRSIEEVARFVMGITNVNRSPRFMQMVETAHRYFDLAEQAKEAEPVQREAIRTELVTMLAPFTDNPAYTALLERRGMIEPEEPEEIGGEHAAS